MLAEGVCSVEDRLHERLPWPVPPRWRREEFAVDATDAMTGETGAKTGARSGVSCVDKPACCVRRGWRKTGAPNAGPAFIIEIG